MEPHADPWKPWYLQWLSSKRATMVGLTALGLLLLVFQVNKMLYSSFRLEIFGVEILEVEHLDEAAPAAPEAPPFVARRHPIAPTPPSPPIPPRPAGPPGVGVEPEETIFVVVDEMPALVGGLEGIQRQIRYPEIARKAGIEGRVLVQFIVDERGGVQGAQVVRGIGGACDEEALRVIKQSRFRPGRQGGQAVKVKLTLPVTFRLAPR
jgi:protein TonB